MLKHIGTKTIETDRLILRKFKINDAQQMFENWASDKEVSKFLTWKSHENLEFTKSLLQSWIDKYNDEKTYHWTIELKEINEVIGDIQIFTQFSNPNGKVRI